MTRHIQTLTFMIQFLAVLAGIFLLFFGFQDAASFSEEASANWSLYISIVFGSGTLIYTLAKISHTPLEYIFCLAVFSILTLSNNFYLLLALALNFSAVLIFSFWMLRKMDLQHIDKFLLALIIFSTIFGGLAHFKINTSYTYFFVVLSMISGGILQNRAKLLKGASNITVHKARNLLGHGNSTHALSKSLYFGVLILHLFAALMPETGLDALTTHQFILAYIADFRAWHFNPELTSAALIPKLAHWIALPSYIMGGENAAKMVNWLSLVVLGHYLFRISISAGASINGAYLANILFMTAGLTFLLTTSFFVDLIWLTMLIAATSKLFETIFVKAAPDNLYATAIFLGGSLAAKQQTLVFGIAFGVFALVYLRLLLTRIGPRQIIFASILFGAIGSIPYIEAYAISGNPVFPFYNGFFKAENFWLWDFVDNRFDGSLPLNFVFDSTFESGKYIEATGIGAPGFHFVGLGLISLVCLPFLRDKQSFALILLMLIWFFTITLVSVNLRYMLPILAVGSLVIGLTLMPEKRVTTNPSLFSTLIIIVAGLNLTFLDKTTFDRGIVLTAMYEGKSRQSYINERLPVYQAVQVLRQQNRKKTPIATFKADETAGIGSDVYRASWIGGPFSMELERVYSAHAFHALLTERNIEYLLVRDTFYEAPYYLRDPSLILQVSDELKSLPNLSIRKLKEDFQLKSNTELLKNTTFANNNFWVGDAPAQFVNHSVLLSRNSQRSQRINSFPQRTFLYAATVSCTGELAKFRMQINWLDRNQNFISFDLEERPCSNKKTDHTAPFLAPEASHFADIYVSAHPENPATFHRVSLTLAE